MGASKEHHFTAVTHRWRARAKDAEARLAAVQGLIYAAAQAFCVAEEEDVDTILANLLDDLEEILA